MSGHSPVPTPNPSGAAASGHAAPGHDVVTTDTAVTHHHDLDHGDGPDGRPGPGALATRFENPGLPVHHHRMADSDPAAARRAERQVATLFGLSALGTLLTLVVYFSIKFDTPMSFTESTSPGRGSALPVWASGCSWRCSASVRAPCTGPRH